MQDHGTGHALELRRADNAERQLLASGRRHHRLAHQDLAGSGLRGDPGRHVHGSAEVVAVLEHHRPGVDAHVGRWQARLRGLPHHVQGAPDGVRWIGEVEHDPVSQ